MRGREGSTRRTPWLLVAAILAVLVQIPVALVFAPPFAGFNAPLTQRIFYYHVPAAWIAYLGFGVTAAASAWHLHRKTPRSDQVARAGAEVGTLFAIIALGTGLLWSGQEFLGYSAVEDPQVISLVVVILSYLGYFALRRGIDEPRRRGRLAAVYGLLAVVGVPLSYRASKVSIHPDFTRPEQTLDPLLWALLLGSMAAFTLLFAALVQLRARLAAIEDFAEESAESATEAT
jgi:heme exporter protein C